MSIFKEPFAPEVAGQLTARQNLIGKENRSPADLVYLNSKTAWVQLRSSVDIVGSNSKKVVGLAQNNVLTGGVLNSSGGQKSGLGSYDTSAYSHQTYNASTKKNENNVLGIRPMPGITNISIQNKGAYGSLRQATVTFQCWDIKQLDILEQLYMRPGYTVLLEWGWSPYLDNSGRLISAKKEDPTFFNRKDIDLQVYLGELRKYSLESNGNYDAMFGYVMNYGWKYRADGGYDCTTEIISTGEILESYKINFSGGPVLKNSNQTTKTLLSNIPYADIQNISQEYSKNVLTGILFETYALCKSQSGDTTKFPNGSGSSQIIYDYGKKKGAIDFAVAITSEQIPPLTEVSSDATSAEDPNATSVKGSLFDPGKDVYITLESLVGLLNNFILLENPSGDNKALIKLSVNDRIELGKGRFPLNCLVHPLQISVDPRVCVIKNPAFSTNIAGIKFKDTTTYTADGQAVVHVEVPPKEKDQPKKTNPVSPGTSPEEIAKKLITLKNTTGKGSQDKNIIAELKKIQNKQDLEKINLAIINGSKESNLYKFLDNDTLDGAFITNGLSGSEIYTSLSHLGKASELQSIVNKEEKSYKQQAIEKTQEAAKKIEPANKAIELASNPSVGYLAFCNSLSQPFYNVLFGKSYGIHSNIYLNLRMLYELASSETLKSQDPAEKQGIALIPYIKNILSSVQNSTGNVNNFEVIIDGQTAYIVDLNYTNVGAPPKPFTFEVSGTKSILRDIQFESQIFSDQSTIIAISAQSDAGKLGLENSSMVAFNTGIRDRMISKKDSPISSNQTLDNQAAGFAESLGKLVGFFQAINGMTDEKLKGEEMDSFKTSLNDIISFLTNNYKSNNKYKSILPTKVSLTFDGIGGIIIGNIFNIDKTFTPSSYKGDESGIDLQYIVTNIKHTIGTDNQWKTVIDGNPSIPDSVADTLNKSKADLSINITLETAYIYDPTTNQVVTVTRVAKTAPITSKQVAANLTSVKDSLGGFTKTVQIASLSVIMKESGGAPQSEDIRGWCFTDNAKIYATFPSRVSHLTPEQLSAVKAQGPVAFADLIYGPAADKKAKLGLGNTQSGDGWRYRGRGFNQLTGRAAYEKIGKQIGVDLVNNPDLANDPAVAAKINAQYLKNNIPAMAKKLKIDPNNCTQEQANILVTNVTAGAIVRNLNKPPYDTQYAKVTSYSQNPTVTKIVNGQ
jgi:predicted chitinase